MYKDKCLYAGSLSERVNFKDSQKRCAEKGAMVLPLKDRATFQFVRRWSMDNRFFDMFIGFNFSQALSNPIYSDKTVFDWSNSYDFDENSGKIGHKECLYLKNGVKYQPRSTECTVRMSYMCLWQSNYSVISWLDYY